MTTPKTLQWTADVVHTLLNYPQRLLEHPTWALVIAEFGSIRQLRQHLLTYPLKTKELRLLEALLDYPDATVEYYCDVLAIHPATFHRQHKALCQRLSGLLPVPLADDQSAPESAQLPNHQPKTSFIGRTLDLERIQLLFDQGCHWISLVGAAGTGKTRLALEMSQRVSSMFGDGICLLRLNDGIELAALAEHCLSQLGLDPVCDDPRQRFQAYFGSRQILLIIDNLNQPELAAWLIDVLQAAPFVRVISTGCQRLNVPNECLHHVEPLGYAQLDSQTDLLAENPALQLMLERLTPFQPIDLTKLEQRRMLIQICQLLDGKPLALELAAGLAATHDLATLVAQLHTMNMQPTSERLASLIQWSYAVLQPTTQQLLGLLAIVPQAIRAPQLIELDGRSLDSINADLLEAETKHFLLAWEAWDVLPSSIQRFIVNLKVQLSSC
ncbi:MAG: hypothetical protein LCH85_16485 [Chloroflexi bacterium]|nr:hypothetical protein [Chloroflexota bacterium]